VTLLGGLLGPAKSDVLVFLQLQVDRSVSGMAQGVDILCLDIPAFSQLEEFRGFGARSTAST
jgi:hypothetical protein